MKKVTLSWRTVGSYFATVGLVKDECRKRILAEASTIRPYGFTGPAVDDARQIAEANGWEVVDE